VSLLCWTASAHSQGTGDGSPRASAIDPFALSFSPGPISNDVLIGPDTIDETETDDASDPAANAGLTELLAAIRQAEDEIAREEALNGPASSGLIEQLVSLAEPYRQIGEFPLAIAALERARQIIRARDGLFSLRQLEIMEATIDTMEEARAYYESDVRQADMLELAGRNADDPRAPSMLAAIADRQMDEAKKYLETGAWERSLERIDAPGAGWDLEHPEFLRTFSGQKSLNRLDGAIRDLLASGDYEIGDTLDVREVLEETYALIDVINDHNEAGQQRVLEGGLILDIAEIERDLALSAFRRARRLYGDALQRMLESGGYSSGDFVAIEQKLIDSYWFELEHTDLYPPRSAAPRNPRLLVYGTGTSTLEARVVHLMSLGSSAVEIANALMAVGDWHLLFSENGLALDIYRDAYDFLTRGDVPTDTWTGIVFPETPVILAQFADDHSAEFDPARIYSGHVDLAIETGRFGQVREAGILGSSDGTSEEVEKRARTHVFGTRFRPRFEDGQALRSDRFTLRYYYDGSALALDAVSSLAR
jgi:tetratricopeptide (TPR) repeat protein